MKDSIIIKVNKWIKFKFLADKLSSQIFTLKFGKSKSFNEIKTLKKLFS